MRKLMVAVGPLAALVVAAALLLPRYIDWSALKPEITAAARELIGRAIAIDGTIGVTLLPAPVLTATRVRLLDGASLPEPLRLDTLELRLALAPLLSGKFRVERLRLINPEIVLIQDRRGGYNWSWPAPEKAGGSSRRLSLDNLEVERGTVIYRAVDGSERRISELDLTARATSLGGPMSAHGHFVADGLPLGFTLRLGGRGADGRLPIPQLTLALPDDAGRLEFRGQLAGAADDRRLTGHLSLRSRDLSRAARLLGWPGAPPRLPAALDARLQADASEAAVNDISLRLADAQLNGAVRLRFDGGVLFDGAMTAGRLDLDALLRAHAPQPGSAALEETAGAPPSRWRLPRNLHGALDVSIDGLGWHDAAVRQIQLSATVADGLVHLRAGRALLPGGSHVTLAGTVATADGTPRFDGRLELQSDNLRRLLAWLGLDLTDVAAERMVNLALATDLSITPTLLQAHGATLRLDGSNAEGGLTYRLQGRPSFGLDLTLDRLALADYLPSRTAAPDYPLSLLRRFDSNLKLSAKQLSWGAMAFKGVTLDLGLLRGQLTVREARVTDLGGASLLLHASASGLDGTPAYIGDLQVASPAPLALAETFGWRAPDGLASVAPLTIDARFEGAGPELSWQATGRLSESDFALDGRIGGLTTRPKLDLSGRFPGAPIGLLAAAFGLTLPQAMDRMLPVALDARFSGPLEALGLKLDGKTAGAQLEVNGSVNAAAAPASFELTVEGQHADSADLLRRLGLAEVAGRVSGGIVLSARLVGKSGMINLDDLDLRLGENRLAGSLALTEAGPRPRVEGRLKVDDVDLARWIAAASTPNAAGQKTAMPRLIDLASRYDGQLEIDIGRLAYGETSLHDVALALMLKQGILDIEQLQGRLFSGVAKLSGRIIAGKPMALDLSATLDEAELGKVLGRLLGSDAVTGRFSLKAELQSLGADPASLARNLSGGFDVEAKDGTIQGLDLATLARSMGRADPSDDIAAQIHRKLTSGQTRLLAATGHWRLVGGVLGTDDSRVSLQGGEARLAGELQLEPRRLALRLEIRPSNLPQAPAIIARLSGPAAAPKFALDAAAFSAYLARQARAPVQEKDRQAAP